MDPLFPPVAVKPGNRQRDRQPRNGGDRGNPGERPRPMEGRYRKLRPLQQTPRDRYVAEPPLPNLPHRVGALFSVDSINRRSLIDSSVTAPPCDRLMQHGTTLLPVSGRGP